MGTMNPPSHTDREDVVRSSYESTRPGAALTASASAVSPGSPGGGAGGTPGVVRIPTPDREASRRGSYVFGHVNGEALVAESSDIDSSGSPPVQSGS